MGEIPKKLKKLWVWKSENPKKLRASEFFLVSYEKKLVYTSFFLFKSRCQYQLSKLSSTQNGINVYSQTRYQGGLG